MHDLDEQQWRELLQRLRRFALWLTREHGVATIPVSVFYQQPIPEQRLVRLCFAKREETLRQAAEKLCAI